MCLPRRGRKAADDRLFLEAMHFFTVENVRWRALPERFGHWNSVWKRFDRLSKAGVFEAFFDTLAEMSTSDLGAIPLGGLTQTADAFAQVQGSLSWIVGLRRRSSVRPRRRRRKAEVE